MALYFTHGKFAERLAPQPQPAEAAPRALLESASPAD
jgi:hypothetical protein